MSDKNFFDNLNSKTAFWLGAAGGLGIMFVIGFFVLLSILLNQGDGKVAGTKTNVNSPAAAVQQPTQPTQPTQPAVAPEVTDSDHAIGPADAAITFIEFSDIQCPFCQRFHPTVQQAMAEYPGQIRWVYKHFPLDSIHPMARSAAEASECVAEQLGDEGFFEYLDRLFAKQTSLGPDLYVAEAVALGANEGQFTSCVESGKYQQKVNDDYQAGLAAGVRGTPTSFINGQSLSGALPYESVKQVIDSMVN